MNAGQQRLFDRLKNALDVISESPETAVQVTSLLEDFAISLEEIAADLQAMSDEEMAATLRAIVHAAMPTQ